MFFTSSHTPSALTFQMAVGFLITVGSIDLIGYIVPVVGWEFAFSFLSFGPLIGVISMSQKSHGRNDHYDSA